MRGRGGCGGGWNVAQGEAADAKRGRGPRVAFVSEDSPNKIGLES